jgi:hypothetical protein
MMLKFAVSRKVGAYHGCREGQAVKSAEFAVLEPHVLAAGSKCADASVPGCY